MTVDVRPARTDERATVLSILDGAALATDVERVSRAIEREDALVVTAGDGGPILGALVLDGNEIANVAVRPNRRGQGIGRALVDAAEDRCDRLWATFDPDVRPFYESLGFTIEQAGDGRLRGERR